MKFALVAISALFGLSLAQNAAAPSNEEAKPAAAGASTKQYVVSFEDEVSSQDFEAVSKWIKERNGEIVESINENFAKLIIAKMDESISKKGSLFGKCLIFSLAFPF